MNPAGTRVYVTLSASNQVTVIDTATNTVIGAPIAVGNVPRNVAVSPDGNTIYVTNVTSNSMSVIDAATRTVAATVALPPGSNPEGIAVSPDGKSVYVAGFGSNKVYVISAPGMAPVFTAASPPTTGVVGTVYPGYAFAASGTTPINFTLASGTLPPGLTLASNGVLAGTPAAAGTYTFTVKASNGVNPDAVTSPITITSTATPRPPIVEAPGLVSGVSAVAGEGQATVSWSAPWYPGSDPVSRYVVTATPGGQTCTVAVPYTTPPTAPATSCTVTGLANGVAYTFTVRAGSVAGLGLPSGPSAPVTPTAEPSPTPAPTPTPTPAPSPTPTPVVPVSILVTGTRDGGTVTVTGTTTGMGMGGLVTPYSRTSMARAFRGGVSVPVGSSGTFSWSRKVATGKTLWVYFTADGQSSNVLRLTPR